MLRGKDPNAVMQHMMQTNPQFAQFVSSNRGKTPEQIAQAYGVDLNAVRALLK